MSQPLKIKTFPLGDFMTNCYVASVGEACWIIDAGDRPQALIAHVQEGGLRPERVILTHAHVDHIAGLYDVRRAFPDAPILIHPAEAGFLSDTTLNLSAFLGQPVVAPDADATLSHGDTLTLGGLTFEVRHTPGHSPGGITLYQPESAVAIAGDTLFAGSIGRYDFPTSDGPTLLESIREQLLTLPDATRVLPGHGPETTVGRERQGNPYLR